MADDRKTELTDVYSPPAGYRTLVVELDGGRSITCHVPPGFDAVDAVTVERWLIAQVRKSEGGPS